MSYDTKYKRLIDLKFINQFSKNDYTAYLTLESIIEGVSIHMIYVFSSDKIQWYKISESSTNPQISFEEVLNLVSDDVKIKMLFNLDLFL